METATNNTNNGHNKSGQVMATVISILDNVTDHHNEVLGHEDLSAPGARNVIHGIILPIICAFGIVGILLTIIVLSRKNMCTSTNCYLLALASADLIFLVLLSTTLGEYMYEKDDHSFYKYSIYVFYASTFLDIFLMTSIWLTVILAMERYIAICQPFYAPHICSICRARAIIVAIYIATFFCRMPSFWASEVTEVFDPSTNTTFSYMTQTKFSLSNGYQKVYPWIVDVLLTTMLPFLFLLVLNVRLIWEVKKSTAYIQRNLIVAKNANHAVQREELQITIMLISIVLVFFVCQFPYIIYTAVASTNRFQTSTALSFFRYITMMLLSLKATINFILYCWFSEKFWVTLKRIFCLHYCTKFPHNYSDLANGSLYSLRRHSSVVTRDTSLTAF